MANIVQVTARMSDGRIASLYDSSVSDNSTTAISTGGSGLAQTSGLSLGQAYPGSTVTHIGATVEGGGSSAFNIAFIEGGNGQCKYVIPISGGGTGEMPACVFPVKLDVGDICKVRVCTSDATEVDACVGVLYSDRSAAVFQVAAVADTKTELTNLIQGTTTWGQTAAGKVATHYYATYNNSGGLNDDGAGNNFFYVEDSAGQLKGVMYPQICRNTAYPGPTEWTQIPIPVAQNDSLFVMWGS